MSWRANQMSSLAGSLTSSPESSQFRSSPTRLADQFCGPAVAAAPKTVHTNIPGSFLQGCQSPSRQHLSRKQWNVLLRPAQGEFLAGSVHRKIEPGASVLLLLPTRALGRWAEPGCDRTLAVRWPSA